MPDLPVNGCRPSADLLLTAIAETAKAKGCSVMWSGGGADGAAGMAAMLAANGRACTQPLETALIDERIIAARTKGVMVAMAAAELGAEALFPGTAHAA